jgi:hypothetical protein
MGGWELVADFVEVAGVQTRQYKWSPAGGESAPMLSAGECHGALDTNGLATRQRRRCRL